VRPGIRRLEIDYQLEFGWLFDWEVSGLIKKLGTNRLLTS